MEIVEVRLGDDVVCVVVLSGCDIFFYMVAIYVIWFLEFCKMFDVNVDGICCFLVIVREVGVKCIVYISSIVVVGYFDGEVQSDEDILFNDWDDVSDYVFFKYIVELEV